MQLLVTRGPFTRMRCNGSGCSSAEYSSSHVQLLVHESLFILEYTGYHVHFRAKPEHTLDLSRYLNDHLAQVVAENPKRFVGLGTLPMVYRQ